MMEQDKKGIIFGLDGYKSYPYNPITERFDGIEEEKRAWVRDFYRAVGYALFLARQENDTSLRQGYILLDNVVEQFLKSYLRNIKKVSFERDKVNFDALISIAREKIENPNDALDRILECHKTRNNLYHSSVYLSISKERFLDYLDDVFSLCKLIGFAEVSDIVSEEYNKIIQSVLTNRNEERFKSLRRIEDLLKDNFGITPGIYQGDILLGCVSGDTNDSAFNCMQLILFGILGMEDVKGKKARVLEVIEANEENADHSFFISYAHQYTWYCFYDCFLV